MTYRAIYRKLAGLTLTDQDNRLLREALAAAPEAAP
jgi:hypothetical protein